MNLLAIETATPACAVGVRTAAGLEVTRVVNEDRRHTEALVPAVAVLLHEVGLSPRDVTRVVVDRGPGLFTGLRVGVATAIAFAQGLGCELVGVTSLELLAHGALDAGVRGRVVACVDGRRGEVFVQSFQLDVAVVALRVPRVATPRDVVIEWATDGARVTFTGDGVARYRSDFDAVPNGEVFAQSVPPPHAALEIGATRTGDETLLPLYLREADAVANFATRQRHE
jgi:tRNA threonylcarbamoyladenosine biosynthesis protein TsaB